MTIYEQIQQAVDFVEDHLDEKLPAARVADAAFMSLRSLHNHFSAVTGYTCGEYVIRRRLAGALDRLRSTDVSVLQAALESGYESHEAFTRAFTREFGASPMEMRGGPRPPGVLDRLVLVKEMYMGVMEKRLDTCKAKTFEGRGENCEDKALAAVGRWLDGNGETVGPRRIFGHNIDDKGRFAGADYTGYRFLITLPDNWTDETTETMPGGRFVVTGIEGSFEDDPEGRWISDGWARMNDMVTEKGYRIHPSGRWFEEHLEPVNPGRMRLDLYLEVE